MTEYKAMGLDLDGVLADFSPAYLKLLRRTEDLPVSAKEMESFGWDRKFSKEARNTAWEAIKEDRDFWAKLPCLVSKETLNTINQFGLYIPVYAITSRPNGYTYSVADATIRWLENNEIPNLGVIVASDKGALAEPLGLRYFLDDKIENVNTVAEATKCEFPLIALLSKNPEDEKKLTKPAIRVESVDEFLGLTLAMIRQDYSDDERSEDEGDKVSGTEGYDTGGEG